MFEKRLSRFFAKLQNFIVILPGNLSTELGKFFYTYTCCRQQVRGNVNKNGASEHSTMLYDRGSCHGIHSSEVSGIAGLGIEEKNWIEGSIFQKKAL